MVEKLLLSVLLTWLYCVESQPASTEQQRGFCLVPPLLSWRETPLGPGAKKDSCFRRLATPLCIIFSSCFILFTYPHSTHRFRLSIRCLFMLQFSSQNFRNGCWMSSLLHALRAVYFLCLRSCLFISVMLISQVWTSLIDGWLQMTNFKFILTWFKTMYLWYTNTLRFRR